MEGLGDVEGNLEFLSGSGGGKGFFVTQVPHVKKRKQVREECSRPQRAAAAEAQFPFYFRRGAVRRGSNIKHQNSL